MGRGQLEVVGGPEEGTEAEKFTEATGIQVRVTFTGKVCPAQLVFIMFHLLFPRHRGHEEHGAALWGSEGRRGPRLHPRHPEM